MPVVVPSTYKSPRFLSNGHVQTCLPTLFRRVRPPDYQRQRVPTSDGDFLDLDWVRNGSRRLAVLAHGLEGNSRSHYMMGMVRVLAKGGFDVVAWNARGCSGEPNRVLRFTHSGATEDLQAVLTSITSSTSYSEIVLVGFSLGGNLTLKYLGERGSQVGPCIKAAVTFSVPCDLQSGSLQLGRPMNRVYMQRFLILLHQKVRLMMKMAPDRIDDQDYGHMRTFKDFDDRYTAPLHGFKDAEDYWRQCSCKPFLQQIQIPTLLVNARNDPFLAAACFPIEEAEENPNLYVEMPLSGGHVGFIGANKEGAYWSETRALEFLAKHGDGPG